MTMSHVEAVEVAASVIKAWRRALLGKADTRSAVLIPWVSDTASPTLDEAIDLVRTLEFVESVEVYNWLDQEANKAGVGLKVHCCSLSDIEAKQGAA